MNELKGIKLLCVLGVLTASDARAQDGYANELFEPQPAQGRAILGVATSHALLQGEFSLGLFAHYADDPMTLVNPDDQSDVFARLIDSRFTTEVLGAVGVFDWLQIGLALPIILTQSGEDLAPVGQPGEKVSSALGDLRVVPQFTILGGAEGFGLHLSVVLSLPTGAQDQFAGDGAVRIRPTLGLGYAASGYRVALEAGYEIRSERRTSSYVSDDMFRWGLAGRIPLVADTLGLALATQGTVQTADGVDPTNPAKPLSAAPTTGFEVMGALELTVADGLVITAGAGTTLMHAAGTPDVRAFLGLGWTSPSGAADGGEIISDPNRDSDKDGVPDSLDRCPHDPEDIDGFQDDDGCPDPDNDGDGIPDISDKCPNVAEDKDGFEDEDGCPELDNDKDGIPDISDKCPNDPEDMDGFEDEDGCPDPDNDGDGVLDAADKCPDLPEVMNGLDDADGCPDTTEKGIELSPTEVKVAGKINFPRDSDKITADSFTTLDAVVRVLKDHPYLTKLRVDGHTDSEGLDAVNLDLSKRRAAAVVAYLVGKGVAPARLVSEGFGESRPIAKNDTPMGRAKNRRVEFKILEVRGKAMPEPAAPPPL